MAAILSAIQAAWLAPLHAHCCGQRHQVSGIMQLLVAWPSWAAAYVSACIYTYLESRWLFTWRRHFPCLHVQRLGLHIKIAMTFMGAHATPLSNTAQSPIVQFTTVLQCPMMFCLSL